MWYKYLQCGLYPTKMFKVFMIDSWNMKFKFLKGVKFKGVSGWCVKQCMGDGSSGLSRSFGLHFVQAAPTFDCVGSYSFLFPFAKDPWLCYRCRELWICGLLKSNSWYKPLFKLSQQLDYYVGQQWWPIYNAGVKGCAIIVCTDQRYLQYLHVSTREAML